MIDCIAFANIRHCIEEGIHFTVQLEPMKSKVYKQTWDSVFNRNTESVTMNQRYLRDCMRLIGCTVCSMLGMLLGCLEIWIQLQGVWEMIDCTLSESMGQCIQ